MKKKRLIIILSSVLVVAIIALILILTLTRKDTLSAPKIVLNDDEVSWSKVSNANSYDVYINDEFLINTNKSAYKLNITEQGEYIVYVKSLSNNNKFKTSAPSNKLTYVVTTLASPNILLDDRTIKWNSVDNALKYEILVDGTYLDYTTKLSYDLDLDSITHKITVKAIGNGKNIKDSLESNEITYKQLLPPILTIVDGYITWPEITNSNKYKIYIDGNTSILEEPRYLVPKNKGLHEIQVSYIGKNEYSSSNYCTKFYHETYEKVDSVTDISKDGNYLRWSAVSHTTGYNIEFKNGSDIFYKTSNTNKFDLTQISYGKYEIRITALGDKNYFYTDSDISYVYVLKYLPALTTPVAKITGYIMSWDKVDGALSYSIYNGNACLIEEISGFSYDLREIKVAGYYNLTVVAKADMVNNSDSEKSNICEFVVTNRLDTPTFVINSNVINITPVLNASGYRIYVDGESYATTNSSEYTIDNLDKDKIEGYIITVVAFSDDKNIWQDSYESRETRFIIRGEENPVSNGIISFDANGVNTSINSSGLNVEAPNTTVSLENGFEYMSNTYSNAYLINDTKKIELTFVSNVTIELIYKGTGDAKIVLKNDISYEIVGVTNIETTKTVSIKGIPEGTYYLEASLDTYILAIIISSEEEDITYVYESHNKESYIDYINAYSTIDQEGKSIYDENCLNEITKKKEEYIDQIKTLEISMDNIVNVEGIVKNFEDFIDKVAVKTDKDRLIGIIDDLVNKTDDEKSTLKSTVNDTIYTIDLEKIESSIDLSK